MPKRNVRKPRPNRSGRPPRPEPNGNGRQLKAQATAKERAGAVKSN